MKFQSIFTFNLFYEITYEECLLQTQKTQALLIPKNVTKSVTFLQLLFLF